MARYLKKSATALFATMLISSNFNSVSALELTTLESTFSYDNLGNTVAYNIDVTNTVDKANMYIITNDNKLRVVGNNILGSTVTDSRGIWVDVIDSETGFALENVVSVKSNSEFAYALTSFGDCYSLTDKGAVKLNAPEKIAKVYMSKSVKANRYFIGESGTLYYTDEFILIDCKGVKFKDMVLSDTTVSSDGVPKHVLIDEKGDIYMAFMSSKPYTIKLNFDKSLTFKDIAYTSLGRYFIFMTVNGDLYYIYEGQCTASTTQRALTQLKIIKNNKEIKAIKFLTNSYKSSLTHLYVVSNDCVRHVVSDTVTDLALQEFNFYQDDVAFTLADLKTSKYSDVVNLEIFRDIQGKTKVRGDYTSKIFNLDANYVDLTDITQEWMNTSNVITEKDLSTFKLETDQMFSRENTFDVDFSIISKTKPVAFNVYFSQALLAGNKSNWTEVEKGVDASKMLISETDTGFINGDGSVVKKQNYMYHWELPNRNLVDVQVILEPVYQ